MESQDLNHTKHPHHHHEVGQLSPAKRQKMQYRLILTIVINVAITLIEVVIGIWVGSMALLSDALHNFSDVLALTLSLIGLLLLSRKAESRQTFGYQRVELVIGLINAISLIFIGLFALRPAVGNLLQYIQSYFSGIPGKNEMLGLPIFIASLISVFLNGLSVYILEGGEHKSVSMRSSLLHLFSDMLTSVAVCIVGITIYFFDIYWMDPFISILIAAYIIFSSYKLAKYSIQLLLNFNVTDIHIDEIGDSLRQDPEVCAVSHVHLWSLSESIIMLEAHVAVNSDLNIQELSSLNKKLKNKIKEEFAINHITFEFHSADSSDQDCQISGPPVPEVPKL